MPAPAWHIFTENEQEFREMLDAFRNGRSGNGNSAKGILPLEVLAAVEAAQINFETQQEKYFRTVEVPNANSKYAFLAFWSKPTYGTPKLEIKVWDYEPTEEERSNAA